LHGVCHNSHGKCKSRNRGESDVSVSCAGNFTGCITLHGLDYPEQLHNLFVPLS
jgi:hypothetical protein